MIKQKTVFTAGLLLCSAFAIAQGTKPAPKPAPKSTVSKPASTTKPVGAPLVLKNSLDTLSYAIGILDGSFFKQQGIDKLNYDVLKRAVQDVIEDKPNKLMEPNMADQILRQKLHEAAMKKYSLQLKKARIF
jgi:hypothetical protein